MTTEDQEIQVPPGHRLPGDRRPLSSDLPLPKKTFSRRRPAGTKVAPPPVAPMYREWQETAQKPREPRRLTGHDLYLTYDINGKLRTHTVYHAPKSAMSVSPRPGKKKPANKD